MKAAYRFFQAQPSSTVNRIVTLSIVLAMLLCTLPSFAEEPATGPTDSPPEPTLWKVGTSTNDHATMPNGQRKVVRTDNGTLHAVWETEQQVVYSFSTDDGKTWSAPLNISRDNAANNDPAIATNGTNLYIAWERRSGTMSYLYYRTLHGDDGAWEPDLGQAPRTITSGWNDFFRRPSIATYAEWVYIAYEASWDGGDYEIAVHRNNNYGRGGWWWSATVTADVNDDVAASIAAYGNEVYLVFQYDADGDWEVWAGRSTNNGANWGGWLQLSDNTAESINPCITNNGTRLFVVWEDMEAGDWDIHYRYTPDMTTNWYPALTSPPANLTPTADNSRFPSVVHEDNVTFVLWQDDRYHANGDVFLSINATGSWGQPMDLTRSGGMSRAPNAFVNVTNGRLDFIYTIEYRQAPHDVVYDYYTISNTAPTLDWTGENGYEADGLDPEGDTTGHLYTYRVEYGDADGDAPLDGYPVVWIDKDLDGHYSGTEILTMSEDDASDTDFTDGKVYTLSTTFDLLGNYTYLFQAKDSKNAWAEGDPTTEMTGPRIKAFNDPPMLLWTEDLGYEFDGIEPNAGNVSDVYFFRVRYVDKYDEAPAAGFPKALFDMNQDGDFDDIEDEEVTMTEVAPQDTTYHNGKVYTCNMTYSTNGTFHYKFVAEDLVGLRNETPVMDGPDVKIPTQIPVLSWADVTGYVTDGVDPDRGTIYTPFLFLVNYSDADGEAPRDGLVEVGLDIDLNGTLEKGEWFPMEEVVPSDTNYTDGKLYSYERIFPQLGTYKYTFRAKDTPGAAAMGVATGIMDVPVDIDNTPPVLKWTNEDNYTTAGLHPATGTTNITPFVYRVRYEDSDGDMPRPGFPKVGIDLDVDGSFEADEFFNMTEVSDTDTNVVDGKLYTYTHYFKKMGTYTYTFKARDEWGMATGTPTGVLNGPTIDKEHFITDPPVLEWVNETGYETDGVNPNTGLTSNEFTFKVLFIDVDRDLPAAGNPKLYIDIDGNGSYGGASDWTLTMTEEDASDTDTTDGKVYIRKVVFTDAGIFNYTFGASSAREGEDAFQPGALVGFVNVTGRNVVPTLGWAPGSGYVTDGVDPDEGAPGDPFEFRVVYTDLDDDPPATGYPVLLVDLNGDGDLNGTTESFEMEPLDEGDARFTDGKVFRYAGMKFSKEGTFKYKFDASDFRGGDALPLEVTGPVVRWPVINTPPVLSRPDIAPYEGATLRPLSGTVKEEFKYYVMYTDVDGDMPVSGSPVLIIGPDNAGKPITTSRLLNMTEVDAADTNVTDGKLYTVTEMLEVGEYSYSFMVLNEANQTVYYGPFDGPVVQKAKKTDDGGGGTSGMGDGFWIIILVIAAVVCLLVGILAGRAGSKKRQAEIAGAEPQERRAMSLTAPEEAYGEEVAGEEEAEAGEEREDEGGDDDE